MITHEIQVLQDVELEALLNGPLGKRSNKADEEEEDERIEHLSSGELACWAYDAPDYGCRTKYSCTRTTETARLIRSADIRDVRKHPRLVKGAR